MGFAAGGLGCEKLLNLIEDLPVDNGRVFAGEPLLLVTGLADVDPVLQKIGKGTIGERNSAVKFPHLGIPALGNDALGVEIRHQLPETLQFQIPLEDIPDSLGFGLVDDELL